MVGEAPGEGHAVAYKNYQLFIVLFSQLEPAAQTINTNRPIVAHISESEFLSYTIYCTEILST